MQSAECSGVKHDESGGFPLSGGAGGVCQLSPSPGKETETSEQEEGTDHMHYVPVLICPPKCPPNLTLPTLASADDYKPYRKARSLRKDP